MGWVVLWEITLGGSPSVCRSLSFSSTTDGLFSPTSLPAELSEPPISPYSETTFVNTVPAREQKVRGAHGENLSPGITSGMPHLLRASELQLVELWHRLKCDCCLLPGHRCPFWAGL